MESVTDITALLRLLEHIQKSPTQFLNTASEATSQECSALSELVALLSRDRPTQHGRAYFGPPQGAVSPGTALTAALVALFNPQLATRHLAPGLNALEHQTCLETAEALGLSNWRGTFTRGGAESNFIALASILHTRYPTVSKLGVRSLPRQPCIYTSIDAHGSVRRAVRLLGLGEVACRLVKTTADGTMDSGDLQRRISHDIRDDSEPIAVVATVGTTSLGAVDPLASIADIAHRNQMAMHVDAAWGAILGISPETRGALLGMERASSVTFDPHKALGCPIGTGMLLVPSRLPLHQTFHIQDGYMPSASEHDLFALGLAWSRTAVAPILHAALGHAGWSGVANSLHARNRVAVRLRARLVEEGWHLGPTSLLPVVTFRPPLETTHRSRSLVGAIAADVCRNGSVWLSAVRRSSGHKLLRVCLNDPDMGEADLDVLIVALREARHRAVNASQRRDGTMQERT